MATSSLLALVDDIASVLDDVAVLSKLAAKKTAGVLGDDLALNAQQVTGVQRGSQPGFYYPVSYTHLDVYKRQARIPAMPTKAAATTGRPRSRPGR